MSDTTTGGMRARHAAPAPQPPTDPSGAPAAVYSELVNHTDDDRVTAADLALTAGLGRSTTGKALVTLEELGLAVRTPGGHDGHRRNPDHWRATPTRTTKNDDSQERRHVVQAQRSTEGHAIGQAAAAAVLGGLGRGCGTCGLAKSSCGRSSP